MADWNDSMNLVCFETLKYERPWELETYLKIGGYEAWKKILAEKTPREQVIEIGQGLRPARPRRRGLPDRAEVVVHAAQRARAEVHGLQLRRERARHLPRPRHPARTTRTR